MRRTATWAATLTAAVLVLTGCSDGKVPGEEPDAPAGAQSWLRLPAEPPSASGPPTGEAMQAKVLLAGADDLEGALGGASTEERGRSTGAFTSGSTVVGYSTDDVSGYDLASGEQLWTAALDMKGGGVCFTSDPEPGTEREFFAVVYAKVRDSCSHLAMVSVADGTVLSRTNLSDRAYRMEDLAGTAVAIHSFDGTDYLRDLDGNIWPLTERGLDLQALTTLQDSSTYWTERTPQDDLLIANSMDECRVTAYRLPSFEPAWSVNPREVFRMRHCTVGEVRGNGLWMTAQIGERYHLAQLDPRTGAVIGRARGDNMSKRSGAREDFDVNSAALRADQSIGFDNGDVAFGQVHGVARYSLGDRRADWYTRMDQWEMAVEGRSVLNSRTFLPSATTPDGQYVVGTVSNDVSVEVVAFSSTTGELVGRWPVPAEYGNGFQTQPGLRLFNGGVVLTRNFAQWSRAFDEFGEKEPDGDRYDIGVFTFPEPLDQEPSSEGSGEDEGTDQPSEPVSTTGPTRHEARVADVVRRAAGSRSDLGAGAFTLGDLLVTHVGGTIEARRTDDPGTVLWTRKVSADPAVQVCSSHADGPAADDFLLGYASGGKDAKCDTVVRLAAEDGEVLDEVEVDEKLQGFSTIEQYEDLEYFESASQVWTLREGRVTRLARLRGSTWTEGIAATDPSLLVGATRPENGKNWKIVGYRLPSFEVEWETSSVELFGRPSGSNDWVTVWDANGLWVSTTFEHPSGDYDKATEVLVELDPATGKVAEQVGPQKRSTRTKGGIKKFHLTGAMTSYLEPSGFDNGDVLLVQADGVMRYSLAEGKVRWGVDLTSLKNSMERPTGFGYDSDAITLNADRTRAVVTMANNTSVEFLELDTETGEATGRWKLPAKDTNGVQSAPSVQPFPGGIALIHDASYWESYWGDGSRTRPRGPVNDVVVVQLQR